MKSIFLYNQKQITTFTVSRLQEMCLLKQFDVDLDYINGTPFNPIIILNLMIGNYERGIFSMTRSLVPVISHDVSYSKTMYSLDWNSEFGVLLTQIYKWALLSSGDKPEMTVKDFILTHCDSDTQSEYLNGSDSDRLNFSRNFYSGTFHVDLS